MELSKAATVLVLAVACWNRAEAQTNQEWPVDATLEFFYCEKGQCNPSHPIKTATIAWGSGTSSRRIFPSTPVTFGPFRLVTNYVTGDNTTSIPPATFHVEVWARSPAFYDSNGRFAAANLQLRRIGSATSVISASSTNSTGEQKDMFVTATLPGAISALQFRASVNSTLQTSSFPGNCGDLPPVGGSASLDDACMQAAVNPLAIINPHIVPLAIIYEPPGNCSYAKLTQTDVVGSTMTAKETQSTTTNTLVDPDIIASAYGANQQNFTWQQSAPDTRVAKLTLSRSQTFGTALSAGLPDDCKQPGASVPPRPNSGPGKGDIFLLLINQPLIYWDQGGLSNFLFGGLRGAQLLAVPAWELMTPAGLQQLETQNHVTLTTDEANAILALDPLVRLPQHFVTATGPFNYPPLPRRFIAVDQPSVSLPSGLSADFSMTRDEIVSADNYACFLSSNSTITDSLGLTEKAEFFAGKTILSFAVGEAVGGGKLADKISDSLKDLSASDLLGNTKTTATIGLSSCKGLQNLQENSDSQDAFLKDTNDGINVVPYYDAFFGTMAYVPLPFGMGGLMNAGLDAGVVDMKLPNFVWTVPAPIGTDARIEIPPELKSKLAAVGFASLQPVSASAHSAPRGTVKGLLPGLQLNLESGTVSGRVAAGTRQKAQALFLVRNEQKKPVAQLWINGEPRQ
jgi:hypothetical protein